MLQKLRQSRAQGILEYIALFLMVMGAFLVFQKYIVRAFNGRWKSIGDTFGHGQIYDPEITRECVYEPAYLRKWYDLECYKENGCEHDCVTVPDAHGCISCIQNNNCDTDWCQR